MGSLKPEKLTIVFKEGVMETTPLIPRSYTLTHSDIMTDLYLTIGQDYVFDKVYDMWDVVLGEWFIDEDGIRYYVYLHMDGQFGRGMEDGPNYMLRRELPLALEAIRYGDRGLFEAHPDLDQSPIIVCFLSDNTKYNITENWGTFADYDINTSRENTEDASKMEYHVLIDEKTGDVTGDGIPDRIYLFGDKSADSPFISNIQLEIEEGQTRISREIITEASGYNPTLFIGDFTKDKIMEIKLSMETGGSGGYGTFFIYSYQNSELNMIFSSESYNIEYQYTVEYGDAYKVNIENVMRNKLFTLDVSNKGYDYVSRYYNDSGELIKPMQGEVLALGVLLPVISSEKDNTFDLLAFQRIIGSTNSDTLGYIENLLSWNGERFASIRMMASTPGVDLIPTN